METMENVKEFVEEVVTTDEMKEAVLNTAEEIVAENSGSILKSMAKGGVIVAGIAGVAYLVNKFVVKPIREKNAAEELDGEDVFDEEFSGVDTPDDSEESESEEIEK